MADQNAQISAPWLRIPDSWTLGTALIAAFVLLPIAAVFWLALFPEEPIWGHLIQTTLPRYASNTIVLMVSVGLLTAIIGAIAAWLVTMCDFPGRRGFEWLLLFPLAVPGYLGAYALVDFLEYAGPVQTALRGAFGWSDARDYNFPDIRSRYGAIFVLTMSLYPYVYLLARAAFREQSGAAHETARALGAGPMRRFLRVGLPLARPAVAAGAAIAMMEVVNDFGTVDFFGVQTLTTGIFTVWLEANNVGGAAQIACVILVVIVALVAIERLSRRRLRFHQMAREDRPAQRIALGRASAWAATLFCSVPIVFGFVLPVGILGQHALTRPERWLQAGLSEALINTLVVCGASALLTVLLALFLVYGVRLSGRLGPRLLLPLTTVGYAAPGAVLALGLLLPVVAFDNALADAILAVTGHDPGLMITGGVALIVYAYTVRFFAISQGATDAAMGRISPSLPMAARTLGRTAGGTLWSVHAPLIRGSVAAAAVLVFVDAVKELPATLLLRPFGFDTLATRAHEQASLEKIADAAPSALLIIAVGLSAVALLAHQTRLRR